MFDYYFLQILRNKNVKYMYETIIFIDPFTSNRRHIFQ